MVHCSYCSYCTAAIRVVYLPRIDQRCRVHLNVAIHLQHFSIKKAFSRFVHGRLRFRLIGRIARFVSFPKWNVIDISSYHELQSTSVFLENKLNKLQCWLTKLNLDRRASKFGDKTHCFVMLPSGTVAGGTAASRLNFCYTVPFGGILASQVVNFSVDFRRWCFKQCSERIDSSFSIIPIFVIFTAHIPWACGPTLLIGLLIDEFINFWCIPTPNYIRLASRFDQEEQKITPLFSICLATLIAHVSIRCELSIKPTDINSQAPASQASESCAIFLSKAFTQPARNWLRHCDVPFVS